MAQHRHEEQVRPARRWRKPYGCTPYSAAHDRLVVLGRCRAHALFSDFYRPNYDTHKALTMRPVRLPGGAA
jgi:hypothetical protein